MIGARAIYAQPGRIRDNGASMLTTATDLRPSGLLRRMFRAAPGFPAAALCRVQGDPSPRGLGWVDWDVPLSGLGSTSAAVQPNGLLNIPNPSQPILGPRGDGSPCTMSGSTWATLTLRRGRI